MAACRYRASAIAAIMFLVPLSAAQAAEPPQPALSAGQAQQLLDVLNDPAKRAAFTSTLAAMTKALPAAHPQSAAPAAHKITLAPNSLGGEVLGEIGAVRGLMLSESSEFARIFSGGVLAGRWLRQQLDDPGNWALLIDALWRGCLVILAARLVEYALTLLLRRPLRALARDARSVQDVEPVAERLPEGLEVDSEPGGVVANDTAEHQAERREEDAKHRRRTVRVLRRAPFAILRLLLKLLPVLAFLAVGNLAGGSLEVQPSGQLALITLTNLYGTGRFVYLLAEMLLAPSAPGVRLLGVADTTAVLLSGWWGWLVAIGIAAFAISDIGAIVGLPDQAAQSIVRAIALVGHVLLAILIWRVRRQVGTALTPPRWLRRRAIGLVLARAARFWWAPAIFFDFALWLVWAAGVQNGYARIWRLFITTLIILFASRLISAALLGLLDRVCRVDPDLERRFPGLGRRANRYYPPLRRLVNAMVLIATLVAFLQAWGLPATHWFTSGALGSRLVSAAISILAVLMVGIAVWELINAGLDRQISHFDRASQAARAVRLQTLLPILRTVLFIVLAVIIGMTVLSEIGVNIAPLLAGAGILGVALGFGSQKLVQDFITGIFLLVENAMQVGDTVTAAGVTGTVEHLSIRTLRLRGGDGSVQIIPFSSVSTVTNLSRDFAVAAIAISVSVTEDADRVCEILHAIGAALRADAVFAPHMLGDFELNGVDGISEYAVALSGSIKCTVGGRWPVQREFFRRLGLALNAQTIAMPARALAVPGLDRRQLEHPTKGPDHE